jgi:pimeloyl-ACP methyl ester carboxylesterase
MRNWSVVWDVSTKESTNASATRESVDPFDRVQQLSIQHILRLWIGLVLLALLTMLLAPMLHGQNGPVKNIVLVHGAWVDGSGWKPVYEILVKDGYHVSVVQEPLTSFGEDVAAVKRILDLQPGPCILVGHSYGGSVITEAGTDAHVVGLVYIAAHMPDAGESEGADGKKFPSDVSKSGAVKTTPDGFNYLDPDRFPEYFAADLPKEQAEFEAHSQMLTAVGNFTSTISTPAWRTKPSSMMVATADRIINPELERWYATRAHSYTVEANGASHSVYESQPKEVAALIEHAALNSR